MKYPISWNGFKLCGDRYPIERLVRNLPSTAKQKDLAVKLKPELKRWACRTSRSLPGLCPGRPETNQAQPVPTIALIAHMDTSPAVSGTGVQPKLHRNYQGQDLVLSAKRKRRFKNRRKPLFTGKNRQDHHHRVGKHAAGRRQQAGIAAIMDVLTQLHDHPELPRRTSGSFSLRTKRRTGRGAHHRG